MDRHWNQKEFFKVRPELVRQGIINAEHRYRWLSNCIMHVEDVINERPTLFNREMDILQYKTLIFQPKGSSNGAIICYGNLELGDNIDFIIVAPLDQDNQTILEGCIYKLQIPEK